MNPAIVIGVALVTNCLALGQTCEEPQVRIPVILDTDIGTDIDDAFALALALATPELELLGVTTVSADAYTRAKIVCRFLEAVGHPEIPVASGRPPRASPALDGQYQYGLRPSRKRPLRQSAVEFILDQLRKRPGQITLICVGDLTNVAELVTKHPEAKRWIKQIVIMGGAVRVGYNNKPPIVREWNIRSDVRAAQTVFASGVPLVVAPLDATASARLTERLRRRIFDTKTPLCQCLHALYELWGKKTRVLFDPVAVTLASDESFCRMERLRLAVDDEGYTREVSGPPNCRVAMGIKAREYLDWYVDRVTQATLTSDDLPGFPEEPTNVSYAVPRRAMPYRVHVVEDYETNIERRWWLAGKVIADDIPPGSTRACEAVLCRDFDGKMGDPSKIYRAVVFNPVPGPPMGSKTRLSFSYHLVGTDRIRVQLYSLSKNYHRHLTLTDLPQGTWQSATVDMTAARRPDGSGGPLEEHERIDDIQFYVSSDAALRIDNIVLYEAARANENHPFPRRIIFTAWFDTGKQGQEWPGDFEIVPHLKPQGWYAAKSVQNPKTRRPWIRLNMRGLRRLGERTSLRFRYRLTGSRYLQVALANSGTGSKLQVPVREPVLGKWAQATIDFRIPGESSSQDWKADEMLSMLESGSSLLTDDVLLYEPAEPADNSGPSSIGTIRTLRDLDVTVLSKDERQKLAGMVSRDIERRRLLAIQRENTAWSKVKSRDDWERFRDQRLNALRESLGQFPPPPKDLNIETTGRIEGDGYRIENIVFESRPGLLVTANLYLPARPRESMPAVLFSHSHHNPKTQGELQDMGITWARQGWLVLVMDLLGHGERRQHSAGWRELDGLDGVGPDARSGPIVFARGRR
ncbi:MAG: nucleoside hydrolase [Planctomycetota bacterium]|jgi:inosine-uridine nucleoside N-ribohydrolase